MIRLGVHVSIAGRIHKAVERAKTLGCNTMQIFSHSPRGWGLKKLNDDEVRLFRKIREEADIRPLYVHTSYLINLCTPDKELYRKSKELFISEIERADILGADYLITHIGSIRDSDEREGEKRVVETLISVSEKHKASTKVLLENTAGERGEIGYTFEQLSEMLKKTEGGIVGGICFDTCHAFSSGYDISTSRGIEEVFNKLNQTIGMKSLKVIHLNDSKRPLGSRIDRHENIGKGFIGIKGFRVFLNHSWLRDIPFILETPKKKEEDDIRNLKVLREVLGV